MSPTTRSPRKSIQGFTMLEVLISIVVIAFGLLGIAGLQAFALQNNQSAGQRMTTTMLANDMVERVWSSNRENRPLYNKNSLTDYKTPVPSCLSSTGCNAVELAQNDLAEWQTRLNDSLPNGQGIICQDSSPDDGTSALAPACDMNLTAPYVIKIWWLDNRTASATAAQPLQRLSWSFNP